MLKALDQADTRSVFIRTGQYFNESLGDSGVSDFIGYARSSSYIHFRFIWPTDLEIMPLEEVSTMIISVKFPSPSYCVVGADALRALVTLTFDFLILDSGHTWRVTWSTFHQV